MLILNKLTLSRLLSSQTLYTLLFTAILFCILRNSVIYPIVFADEYSYSVYSRHISMDVSGVPSYLYLYLYHFTDVCQDGFLNCARLLNVLLFFSAVPFIYLCMAKIKNIIIKRYIILLVFLGPLNSYSAYFMPESMYFLFYIIFLLQILLWCNDTKPINFIITGLALGLASLVKPHALFLIIPSALYIFIWIGYINCYPLRKSFICANIFIISVILFKILVGYIFAGISGVTFFGKAYGSVAVNSLAANKDYVSYVYAFIFNFFEHIKITAWLFGVPIASMLYSFIEYKNDNVNINKFKLSLLTALILIMLILMTAFFTSLVSGQSELDTDIRLHGRYYNFALPILLIIVAFDLDRNNIKECFEFKNYQFSENFLARLIIFLLVSIPSTFFYVAARQNYNTFVDFPEISWIPNNFVFFSLLSVISIISLIVWLLIPNLGAMFFLFIFSPLVFFIADVHVNKTLWSSREDNVYIRAGVAAKKTINNDEISKTMVVGLGQVALFHTLFQIDNPSVMSYVYNKDEGFDCLRHKKNNRKYFIFIGENYNLNNCNYISLIRGDGFDFVELID